MTDQLDSETRIKDDDHHALKLWLRLLTCTNLVQGYLRQQLRESFDSTLPRFDLLAQLDRRPQKLRMGELTKLMMVSGGNVTGLVTQLEKEGLVKRTPMETDRRTFLVGLTKKGKSYFDKKLYFAVPVLYLPKLLTRRHAGPWRAWSQNPYVRHQRRIYPGYFHEGTKSERLYSL